VLKVSAFLLNTIVDSRHPRHSIAVTLSRLRTDGQTDRQTNGVKVKLLIQPLGNAA